MKRKTRRIAGYEDTNDADYLRHDPTMREVVGRMEGDRRAASSSQMARWETEFLTGTLNFDALRSLTGAWVQRVQRYAPIDRIVLDTDSSGSPTYGNQQGAAYNGHLGEECYHPLSVSISAATWRGRCSVRATSTAPKTGT